VTNAKMIIAQHPKKIRATSRTIDERPNPLEEIGKMIL
jgi:hypothetical protein